MKEAQGRVCWSPIGAVPVRDRLALLTEVLGLLRDADARPDGGVWGFMQCGDDSVFVVWSATNEVHAQMVGSPIRDVPGAAIDRIGQLVLSFARGYTLTASRT